uniref:Stress-response A/B barrel domain-containing protein n=1 Tax=Oryza meridionalis TaxID=40149 RepID=A0A0E0C2X2_9ORYZ
MAAETPAAGGVHIVLARFKEEVTPERLDHLIRGFGSLVNLVPSMKAFNWGTDNMHQGFTHVFESTFESTEGVKEYIEHPAHVEFANEFLPVLEKTLIIDYKPTIVNNS